VTREKAGLDLCALDLRGCASQDELRMNIVQMHNDATADPRSIATRKRYG
jgi:hypothetical protein